jgi:hypothetical protein
VAAAKKPVGWMQSPEARKDRADPMVAGQRKDQAKRLRALPKAAQRAIRLERMNYGGTGANRMSAMRDIAEGRVILMGNVGKRKNKRSAGEVQAIAQQMNRSATRLKAGMATGSRGRMKYNPRAVEASGKGTAARKIRGARVAGVARKGKAAPAKPIAKVDMKQAISRAKELRQQASKLKAQGEALMGGGRRDGAIVNIPLSSRSRRSAIDQGIRGSQLVARAASLNNRAERVLERAVASRKKAEREAAKPARAPRSAESLRLSRAKQVEKRRGMNISNPAGWRDDSAGRMAANAARTQQRALAFYGGKAKKKAVASRSAATSGLRPGELMNANARPVGTMAKPPKYKDPYETTGNWWKFNVMTAQAEAKKRGAAVGPWTSELGKILQAPGAYNPDSRQISFNGDSPYWRDPTMASRMSRFTGHHSSANPLHTVLHEIGHQRDKASRSERVWRSAAPSLARRVSKYATTNRAEFVAEVYAGIQSGMKFDYQVMRAYRQAQGLSANPPARRRSRLRRPRKP